MLGGHMGDYDSRIIENRALNPDALVIKGYTDLDGDGEKDDVIAAVDYGREPPEEGRSRYSVVLIHHDRAARRTTRSEVPLRPNHLFHENFGAAFLGSFTSLTIAKQIRLEDKTGDGLPDIILDITRIILYIGPVEGLFHAVIDGKEIEKNMKPLRNIRPPSPAQITIPNDPSLGVA